LIIRKPWCRLFKNSKFILHSKGYDEIPVKILKSSAPFISSPLAYICNKALETGVFPTRLKYSVIKPFFKGGDKTNMSNYRPISLMTSFSKVLEKIISSYNE
jgi:hypothetical protein